jgi:phosphatidylglycerophosphate synthase
MPVDTAIPSFLPCGKIALAMARGTEDLPVQPLRQRGGKGGDGASACPAGVSAQAREDAGLAAENALLALWVHCTVGGTLLALTGCAAAMACGWLPGGWVPPAGGAAESAKALVPALITACAAVQALSVGAFVAWFHRSPRFATAANAVTMARAALAIFLAGTMPASLAGTTAPASLAEATPACTGGALALVALAFIGLDFLDGALARALGQASRLGGTLDEEADSFGTLVVGLTLWARGIAAWPVVHMAFAHYVFILLHASMCPAFAWSFPLARTLAGVMAVGTLLALVASDHSAPLARLLGNGSSAVSLFSFGIGYKAMFAHGGARRRQRQLARRHGGTGGGKVGKGALAGAGAEG